MTTQEGKNETEYPNKQFGCVYVVRRLTSGMKQSEWIIELPHSCDEWVIGTPEEARAFVTNIQAAITYCDSNP